MVEVKERWGNRDLPVLVAAARQLDDSPGTPVREHDVLEETGLSSDEAMAALVALHQGGYLIARKETSMAGLVGVFATDLTERGRRTVGIWPAGEAVDALVDALRQAEQAVQDPEERTLLRRAAGAVGSVSRDVMTDVLAAVVVRSAGL